MESHKIDIRVRYQETDGQGIVHHGNYLTYFEKARIEYLRALGISYRDVEEAGLMLVVAKVEVNYFQPAYFDDQLQVDTRVISAKGAAIIHEYQITRGDDLIVQGTTRVGCLTKAGKVTRVPKWLGGKGDFELSS
ncbi:MAG: thioesterase [Planctomycetaceae bacterium]|nr:thioesterase [Planctomycetaceae bacterium]